MWAREPVNLRVSFRRNKSREKTNIPMDDYERLNKKNEEKIQVAFGINFL